MRLSPGYRADLLVAGPKVTQAIVAALGDYYTWKLGERVYGVGGNEAWATVCIALPLTLKTPRTALVLEDPVADFLSLP